MGKREKEFQLLNDINFLEMIHKRIRNSQTQIPSKCGLNKKRETGNPSLLSNPTISCQPSSILKPWTPVRPFLSVIRRRDVGRCPVEVRLYNRSRRLFLVPWS